MSLRAGMVRGTFVGMVGGCLVYVLCRALTAVSAMRGVVCSCE